MVSMNQLVAYRKIVLVSLLSHALITDGQVLSSICANPTSYDGTHVPVGLPVLDDVMWDVPHNQLTCNYLLQLEINGVDPNVAGVLSTVALGSDSTHSLCFSNTSDAKDFIDFYATAAGCCTDGISRCHTDSPTASPTSANPTLSPTQSPTASPTTANPTLGPTQAPTCDDVYVSGCENWHAAGMCNQQWVKGYCPTTCKVPGCTCDDQFPSGCAAWADEGKCDSGNWYKLNCPTSCDVPECSCEDQYRDGCKDWASQGLCSTSNWYVKNCPSSCNVPRCKSPTSSPTLRPCKDTYPSGCAQWAQEGLCETSKWHRDTCPTSCKRADCVCVDQYPTGCAGWAQEGLCSGAQWYRDTCPVSCNTCP